MPSVRKFKFVWLAGLFLPFTVAADETLNVTRKLPRGTGPITKIDDILSLLAKFADWASIAFWILAFVFVLLAAFQYLTSGGNPEKIKDANKRLLWGVIAIAVGLMSYGIASFVNSILRSR